MATLLLRLAAPLQAWGSTSKFDMRHTDREPTKSGVIGLLAAALGYSRDASLDALCKLRFGVRVDRGGELVRDFHMVHGKESYLTQLVHGTKESYLTHRYYLSDAVFLAALEGEDADFLAALDDAVRHPVYPLFLGRRSCPPTLPVTLGVRDGNLRDVLMQEPPLTAQGTTGAWKLVMDASAHETASAAADARARRQDVPISFHVHHREYGYRKVEEVYLPIVEPAVATHDPMAEL